MLEFVAEGVPVIPDDQRLDGWKAIANHLGRERTTAIRWANARGMPVHRVPGGRTGTVYALRSELEAWLAGDRDDAVDPVESSGLASGAEVEVSTPRPGTRTTGKPIVIAALVALLAWGAWLALGRGPGSPAGDAPVSIGAVAALGANRETLQFARSLNADLARFAHASPDLAVFESEPDATPDTQYTIRTEIEGAHGKMIANARLIAAPRGQVIWSRRFEQAGPALSALREQIAANLVDVLRCSFGGLEAERAKVQPADLEQLMAICESFEANDFTAAETRARRLTIAHPDLSLGWALLAMIEGEMVGQGNDAVRAQAIANSRMAATIAPGGTNTWLAKAAASVGGPTSPEALPIIDQALRMHPDNPWLLTSRSIILFNLGYVRASVADSISALRNDPGSFGGRDVAVRRLAAAGRTVEALQLQAENERLWTGHPQVVAVRGWIEQNDGARRAADLALIIKSERDFSNDPTAAYRLARLHERTGNRQAALAWLTRAPVKNALVQWSTLFWPDAAGLRAEPAFFRKMADLGLVRWWIVRKQWPDFCADPKLKYDCADEAGKLHFTLKPRPLFRPPPPRPQPPPAHPSARPPAGTPIRGSGWR